LESALLTLPEKIIVTDDDSCEWEYKYREAPVGMKQTEVIGVRPHEDHSYDYGGGLGISISMRTSSERGKQQENDEKNVPSVTFSDIGGIDDIIQQVREVIELPLIAPTIFEHYHIKPHKGILLYGPPGCGKRAKCEEGKVYLPYKQFLGYEKGPDGQPQIVEGQAKTVRLIYALFLDGLMPSGIAKRLEAMGALSPAGKQRWQTSTVESILRNEKYKGDALLQKTFCVDFLTKKMKRNEGELPQYYVEQSHPAIVSPEVFDEVQQELKRRREARYVGRSGCFSSKIICGECGSYYGRKVWHSNDKYRTVIWRCQHKYNNGEPCKTPHVTEDQIKAAFVTEMNRVIANKEQVLSDIRMLIETLTTTHELEEKESAAGKELEAVSESMRKLVDDYARTLIEQNVYHDRYVELLAQSRLIEDQIAVIGEQREQRKARKRELDSLYKVLKATGPILEFDEELWNLVVEHVTTLVKGEFEFSLLL
jgi:hypothetical protein